MKLQDMLVEMHGLGISLDAVWRQEGRYCPVLRGWSHPRTWRDGLAAALCATLLYVTRTEAERLAQLRAKAEAAGRHPQAVRLMRRQARFEDLTQQLETDVEATP